MSSLFNRVTVPLLAVTAAALLCAPARAASAAWADCEPDPHGFKGIAEQVECSSTSPDSYWQTAVYNNNRLGGGDDHQSLPFDVNEFNTGGDYYDPATGYRVFGVAGGGTYNCWCICNGIGVTGAWSVSTGGTTYVNIP